MAIFSTVRTQVGRSIGFVADERRMNVGLTRARSSLIVIGNAKALKGDERWGNLIKQATVDRSASGGPVSFWFWLCHDMTCCDELCCAVLCCAVLCCAVLCCPAAVFWWFCCDSGHASKTKKLATQTRWSNSLICKFCLYLHDYFALD